MTFVKIEIYFVIRKLLRQFNSSIPANIRLGEDVLKTSSRRLQCNIFLSSKTSWRRLEDIIAIRLANTPWRRLEDILGRRIVNTSWKRRLERLKVLRWRRLQDVLKNKKCLLGSSRCKNLYIHSLCISSFKISKLKGFISKFEKKSKFINMCETFWSEYFKSSRSQMFFKLVFRPATLLRIDSNTAIFLWILRNL